MLVPELKLRIQLVKEIDADQLLLEQVSYDRYHNCFFVFFWGGEVKRHTCTRAFHLAVKS